ncbi:MAG: thioredoxin-dependent thiol peroxidase [Bacteroidales bacterium]|jgi:peroxiredoxin Q/BCP|nr:thioredoxin-dependent thiol peroxidase [Bacteroidales bacterium]
MNNIEIDKKAPEIVGIDQFGNEIKLSDYLGKKLIIFFYPKDNTPGCTAQACNLRDNYSILQKAGFEIIGISIDSEASHQKFSDKHSLPFPLLPDTEKKIVNDYGVWGEKKFMGRTFLGTKRTTFVIDENGNIEKIFDKVKTKAHAEQILESYK